MPPPPAPPATALNLVPPLKPWDPDPPACVTALLEPEPPPPPPHPPATPGLFVLPPPPPPVPVEKVPNIEFDPFVPSVATSLSPPLPPPPMVITWLPVVTEIPVLYEIPPPPPPPPRLDPPPPPPETTRASTLPPWVTFKVPRLVNVWIRYPSTSVSTPPDAITPRRVPTNPRFLSPSTFTLGRHKRPRCLPRWFQTR